MISLSRLGYADIVPSKINAFAFISTVIIYAFAVTVKHKFAQLRKIFVANNAKMFIIKLRSKGVKMEERLLELIKKQYKSVRQFAVAVGIPYSTIDSGLKRGVRGMSVDIVIKMCKALGITVEDLLSTGKVELTHDQRRVLSAMHDFPADKVDEVLKFIDYLRKT